MIRGITIDGFRCFKHLEVRDVSLVNVFMGKNNSGKTSLLEALFLSTGSHNPGLSIVIDNIRGMRYFDLQAEEIWGWLFNEHDTSKEIRVETIDEVGGSTKVILSLSRQVESSLASGALDSSSPTHGSSDSSALSNPYKLLICSRGPDGAERYAEAWVENGEIRQRNAAKPETDVIFLSSKAGHIEENASRLSRLSERKRHDMVVKALKILEPRLTDLAILTKGGKAIIAGSIDGLDWLVPSPYLGEGFNKLLTLVLAIASSPGGVVLVDEIENGFHHSALGDLWRVICRMATQSKTQLFISTHSYECLQNAFHVSSEEFPPNTCAFQRIESDGETSYAVSIDSESLEIIFESKLEVR